MHVVCALLALLAAPFWETKGPKEWSEEELAMLMHDSPWAQMAEPAPAVALYLATARPLQDAEAELARRRGKQRNDEYLDFVQREGANNIVVAVAYPSWEALNDGEETRNMQNESTLNAGRKKYKMSGYFPPTPSDPVLRLVFPRAATEADKTMTFELYLPG